MGIPPFPELARIPAKWNHFAERDSRQFNFLEQILIAKVFNFGGICFGGKAMSFRNATKVHCACSQADHDSLPQFWAYDRSMTLTHSDFTRACLWPIIRRQTGVAEWWISWPY
jgi:hypothetical protein